MEEFEGGKRDLELVSWHHLIREVLPVRFETGVAGAASATQDSSALLAAAFPVHTHTQPEQNRAGCSVSTLVRTAPQSEAQHSAARRVCNTRAMVRSFADGWGLKRRPLRVIVHAVLQNSGSLPFLTGPHDAIRDGLVTLKDGACTSHPAEVIQNAGRQGVEHSKLQMLQSVYGSALPAMMSIERQILSR